MIGWGTGTGEIGAEKKGLLGEEIHMVDRVSSANLTDVSLRPISTVILSAAAIIVVAVEGPRDLSRKPAAVAGV